MPRWWQLVPPFAVVVLAGIASVVFFRISPSFSRAVYLTQLGFSLATLLVVVMTFLITINSQLAMHRDLLAEQRAMRRSHSRPQVLVYFARLSEDGLNRLVLIVKHFGGGPALDVRFEFDPPLVNRDGQDIGQDPPLSTGIAVLGPGESRVIDFANFYRYQDDAGLANWARPMGLPVSAVPVGFRVTITLRDPLGDDQVYADSYDMSLRDLMTYTMRDTLAEELPTAPVVLHNGFEQADHASPKGDNVE
jgi:hypothetical protein